MFSRFFIDRPVLASVISIIITLCGGAALYNLPVEQSPEITPPTVQITAMYPGADAETVAQSIAAPIEQELSGIENLLYYSSQSANDGSLNITLTFEIGSDQDIAAVEVQNRLKRVEPRLPAEVVRQGISVAKVSSDILAVVSLSTQEAQYDDLYLSNYATIYMLDSIKRVPGVGDANVFGSKDYSMRIWLDPDKLASRELTVSDVAAAVREQNGLFAAGRIGAAPSPEGTDLTIPVITRGRLSEPEEFENIVVRADPDGSFVRVRDIGRVELGSVGYDAIGRLNGQPTTLMLISLQPGANALDTMAALTETLDSLAVNFPAGIRYDVPFDTTPFIRVSIEEVTQTFFEAVLLVVLVVFLFLGTWRATIIPVLAVPVAIVGTFTGMLVFGFSVNSLTMFGLVLAIGIVVDDAIVVVENVERVMREEGLHAREATIKAMQQVTGPVIAIVLVLSAVYLPVAFIGGLTGVMYRQFAITIATSVAISGFVALTLSPALCRVLLEHKHEKWWFFRWFDNVFGKATALYTAVVRRSIRWAFISLLAVAAILCATWVLFERVPGAFVPQEDQGYFMVAASLPQGASLQRTSAVMAEIEQYLLSQPEIYRVVSLCGQDFLAGRSASTSAGAMFVSLRHWNERQTPDLSVDSVIEKVRKQFGSYPKARVLAFNPPAVRGLGVRAGFEAQLESRGISDVRQLAEVTDRLVQELQADPMFEAVSSVLNVNQPQIYVDLDRTRAKAMGLPIDDIFDNLQAYLGTLYVNDFNKYGRIYRVQLQADAGYRSTPDDIRKVFVRNETGDMVELSGVLDISFRSGPNVVSRFNSYPAVQVSGTPAPGFSTGQAMEHLTDIAARVLPAGYAVEWSGASYQEERVGNQAPIVITFGLIIVFLVLAGQYEKWSLPLAVLCAVPIALFGAILAVYLRGLERDIYFQIGLLTLIGLAAKNAILIVEFCAVLRREGRSLVDSAVEAARIRLRPIVMTSFAFILGVVPLAVSQGAGANSRHSIGTTVIGGMLAATLLATVFVPLFFVIIQGASEFRLRKRSTQHESKGNQS